MSLARYVPQLDGLRAVAVLGVLCDHFAVHTPDWLPWGQMGVRFFFILSGFFATLSLWRAKERMEEAHGSVWGVVRDYYAKRLLRIGPAYYLTVLAGAFILGIPELRDNLLWHLAFLSNLFIATLGYWPLAVSHFWSLSVQEQFYLIWPWLVLLLPRAWFLIVCLLLIPLAQMFCGVLILLDAPAVARWVLLPGCIDAFAYGALGAHLVQMAGAEKVFSGKRSFLVFGVALVFLAFGIVLRYEPEHSTALGFVEMFEGVFLVWMLAAVYFARGFMARLLGSRPLVAVGKISFGLYIYHIFVIILYDRIPMSLGWPLLPDPLRVAVLTAVSLAFAAASYRWVEQPVLRWWKTRHARSPMA
jgi:peptidoglycan/LPS O-acetylase OafA/YrhL